MLRAHDYGPVQFFSLARSLGGRSIMSCGVYFVDGMLIDTGPANAHAEFAAVVDRVDAEQVVLTHHHEDHTGNAAFAAHQFDRPPQAHSLALPLVRKRQPLAFYRRLAFGVPEPCEAEALGDVVHTRRHVFDVIHTPGHALDHVVLHEPTQKWLFTGDLFLSPRHDVLHEEEDITVLMQSLRTLMELPDCKLFCQHSGAHDSHQTALGGRLDFLLGMQKQATVLHEEGRTVREIVAGLGIGNRSWHFVSRGELSARHLVRGLLVDAGVAPSS